MRSNFHNSGSENRTNTRFIVDILNNIYSTFPMGDMNANK